MKHIAVVCNKYGDFCQYIHESTLGSQEVRLPLNTATIGDYKYHYVGHINHIRGKHFNDYVIYTSWCYTESHLKEIRARLEIDKIWMKAAMTSLEIEIDAINTMGYKE